ncbi:hypothetical protein DSCA_14670 [Desulfosarcina alkanivorans]|jgi:hypothetical protein|uniref:Coiled coil domain-containing protein n=1 Tax=Desulfosarcina alkanivorans TaxID=571177 RepID=A0A5K7YSB1_9BACT|nr:hypothetical protein [Desulfosarcina alkanivorans]BBO67537.1 hypothetical protein DSCA_14670 [Desulfosarcina alkanivorans]
MVDKKEAFVEQLKKKYDHLNYLWNIERNKLEAGAQHESAEVIKKFEEKRERFRNLRGDMKAKIKALDLAGESAWGDMKDGAEEAWKALAEAFEKASSHFKK